MIDSDIIVVFCVPDFEKVGKEEQSINTFQCHFEQILEI